MQNLGVRPQVPLPLLCSYKIGRLNNIFIYKYGVFDEKFVGYAMNKAMRN